MNLDWPVSLPLAKRLKPFYKCMRWWPRSQCNDLWKKGWYPNCIKYEKSINFGIVQIYTMFVYLSFLCMYVMIRCYAAIISKFLKIDLYLCEWYPRVGSTFLLSMIVNTRYLLVKTSDIGTNCPDIKDNWVTFFWV